MAKNQNKRIRPVRLREDMDALVVIQLFSDYSPANPAYAVSIMQARLTAMKAAQDAELNLQNALAAARDAAVAREWEFHNALLGAKVQVTAQYGDSSDQLQAMGLKKKSERKPPGRKKKAAA